MKFTKEHLGAIVRIKPKSRHWCSANSSNPKNTDGHIYSIDDNTDNDDTYHITVNWSNHTSNTYSNNDLILIKSKNTSYEIY